MIIYSTKEGNNIIFTWIISKYSQSSSDIMHIWDKICLFKKFQHLKKMWDNQNSKILKSETIGNKQSDYRDDEGWDLINQINRICCACPKLEDTFLYM